MLKIPIRYAHGNIGYGVRISSCPWCIYRHRSTNQEQIRAKQKALRISESLAITWLRGRDLNPRPPGYEPDELPTALPRVIVLSIMEGGTGDRTRTGTRITSHRILSPRCLPIPPLRHIGLKMAPRVGLEPTTYRLTAGCSAIELPRNVCRFMRLDYYSLHRVPCQHLNQAFLSMFNQARPL